jgi:hypothetical protein
MSNAIKNIGYAIFILIVTAMAFACAYGWVMNIVILAHAESFSGLVLLRGIGIFVAPLGAVLGLIGG